MSSRKRNILYLGEERGTSLHRVNALRRLGHNVTVLWPERLLPQTYGITGRWVWHTGGLFLEGIVRRRILDMGVRADFVIVDHGELIGPGLVEQLKKKFGPVINYNGDDPYGGRDGSRWRLFLKSIPAYDMLVVPRKENVGEAAAHGARKVMRVFHSADEVAHAPGPLVESARARWASEVSFVGTWMPERGPLMAELVSHGVPLAIYGDRWDRAPEWKALKRHWRGAALVGADYRDAIKYSRICIGLLSKGNRDLHTQRSMEIPYIGSLLCAERTSEHLELYADGEEAVFWSSVAECAERCMALLANEGARDRIAAAGQRRAVKNGHLNEQVMARLIEASAHL
jgi:hypothetical protein